MSRLWMVRRQWSILGVGTAIALGVLPMPDVGRAGTPTPQLPEDADAWASALTFIEKRLRSEHPDPFRAMDEAAFHAEVARIRQGLHDWSRVERAYHLYRLVQSLRDGHTRLPSLAAVLTERSWPFQLRPFGDVAVVVRAAPEHRDFVGATLESVHGVGVPALLEALRRVHQPETEAAFRAQRNADFARRRCDSRRRPASPRVSA